MDSCEARAPSLLQIAGTISKPGSSPACVALPGKRYRYEEYADWRIVVDVEKRPSAADGSKSSTCGRTYSFFKLHGKRHVPGMTLLGMADMQHEGKGICSLPIWSLK